MTITTERLLLRSWQESDAEALYRYAKDSRIGPSCGWNPHQSIEESLTVIRTTLAAAETYAVCLRETGEPIGCIALETGEAATLPLALREAELGYWLGVPYWGRGYIPEAADAIISRAFTELSYNAIFCACNAENSSSRRVMEKCCFNYMRSEEVPVFTQDAEGWTFTGQTRERYIARLTRLEWQEQQSREKA